MNYPFSDMYADKTRPRLGQISFTDPSQMARDWMGQASGTYARMQAGSKTETKEPGPIVGGGATATGLGATMGAYMGSGTSVGGWWGAGIGAVLGLGSYLFS